MRLAHQTFLVLLAAVLVTAIALGSLFAFNLERGFVDYINAQQGEQLDRLARLLEAELRRVGSVDAFRRDPRLWRALVEQSAGGDDESPRVQPAELAVERDGPPAPLPRGAQAPGPRPGERRFGPPRPRDEPRPGRDDPRFPRDDLPMPREMARRDPPPVYAPSTPVVLGGRVELLAADRTPVLPPRPVPPNAAPAVERNVALNGSTAAVLRAWPWRKVGRADDVAFLHAQYANIAWGAGGLALLMGLVAPLVARRITKPLRSVAQATARIAGGDLGVRLATQRSDEIGTLMRNVDAMAESLANLERARRRWIAEISHELRTPLTVLRGELEALVDGVRPLERAALGSLQAETAQLTRLVDDLHQLALADIGALSCTLRPVDVGDCVERAVERMRERVAARGLRIEATLPDKPVIVQADAQRLDQVLTNVLENSVRYTNAPGRIEVRMARAGAAATIVIEDTPPGVAAEQCERLFDPLYRADPARSRASGGSGLGLAIARAIVAAHHGRIQAAPSRLGGLAVTITLPAPA